MTPQELARAILELPVRDLAVLNRLLREEGLSPLGVREPREPSPESPGDAIAHDLPEDYWETAQ